tara:strand:+ start:121 stop:465 length:345 start_codon:yes stop_codon:yes gene_type:complete
MEEKNILKISLLLVLLGLIFLYLYSVDLNLNNVKNFDNLQIEEKVKAEGVVEKVSVSDKVIFLKLSALREQQMDVIVFNDEEIFIQEGDLVEISGEVEEYNGKKEIIASKVIVK